MNYCCGRPSKSCDFLFIKYLLVFFLAITSFLSVVRLLADESDIKTRQEEFQLDAEDADNLRFELIVKTLLTAIVHICALVGVFAESLPILLPTGSVMLAMALAKIPSVQLVFASVNILLIEAIICTTFGVVLLSDYVKATHFVIPRKCSCESEMNQAGGEPLQWSAV